MRQSTSDRSAWADAAFYHIEPANPAGWSEVCKGVCGVLGSLVFLVGLAIAVATTSLYQMALVGLHFGSNGLGLPIAIVLILLFFTGYGFFLMSLLRCLQNVPERKRAKWWMYAAVLCAVVFAVLFLYYVTSLVFGSGGSREHVQQHILDVDYRNLGKSYADVKELLTSATLQEIDFCVIGVLCNCFVVLFFRSIALYFYDGFRTRFVELFLLLNAALVGGLMTFIVSPVTFQAQPILFNLLLGGVALSGLWYVALYVSTITCIQSNMPAMRSPLS